VLGVACVAVVAGALWVVHVTVVASAPNVAAGVLVAA